MEGAWVEEGVVMVVVVHVVMVVGLRVEVVVGEIHGGLGRWKSSCMFICFVLRRRLQRLKKKGKGL